jgi:hypothetical protein
MMFFGKVLLSGITSYGRLSVVSREIRRNAVSETMDAITPRGHYP